MNTAPIRVTKNNKNMWLMPNGDYIPYIAGGSNDEPTVEELKAQLEEERNKTSEARNDAAKYRTKLRETESSFEGVDIEEYKTLKEKQKEIEEKKALEKGEYEKLISEKTASLSEKIKENEEQANKWKRKYESKVVDDEIKKIASANNAINNDDVITILKSQYNTAVDDDGKVKFYKGEEIATDGNGNPITIDSAVKSLLDERSYLVKGAENGAGNNGGTGKTAEKELNSLDLIKKGLQSLK